MTSAWRSLIVCLMITLPVLISLMEQAKMFTDYSERLTPSSCWKSLANDPHICSPSSLIYHLVVKIIE